MSRKTTTLLVLLMTVALVLAACGGNAANNDVANNNGDSDDAMEDMGSSTLHTVQERGTLVCGGNASVPGFGFVDEDGSYSGFDIDFCRAVAAAVLGDANALEVRPLTGAERFTALAAAEIDLLIRNTTWTLSRDTELGASFASPTFYDGQGMMVRKDAGISTLEDFNGLAVCVQTGTTTELNLADQMAKLGVDYTPLVFDNADNTRIAYDEGQCDGFTTDKSGLVSQQGLMTDPEAHTILEVTMSKEPLGPVTRHGDDQWFDIVNWVVIATIQAEEWGITSANVDSFLGSGDPSIAKMLGEEGEMGAKLGISDDWAYQVIKQVGNYGEIYNSNLGPDTPTYIPRGLNSLYTEGGILYAPPIR